MTTIASIEDKIQELCAAIVADEEVSTARANAEAFLADMDAVTLYRETSLLGRELHQKGHKGEEPTPAETRRFNELQDRSEAHPGIAAFIEAQQVLQGIAETVSNYVSKTLETGKVPTEEEAMGSGGCGEGCGCH
jgi:cell fate (sporulation/competence/biofilm development) regulator YlbF (YheA/YmcA/DUF963 family)